MIVNSAGLQFICAERTSWLRCEKRGAENWKKVKGTVGIGRWINVACAAEKFIRFCAIMRAMFIRVLSQY